MRFRHWFIVLLVSSFRYHKSDCPEGVYFFTLVTKGQCGLPPSISDSPSITLSPFLTSGSVLTFHRADFQTVLLRKLPTSYRIHCSKRLRSYSQQQQRPNGSSPITLLFEDGTSTLCDVLVGADGLKSAVRRCLLGEKASRARSQDSWSEAADITALIEPVWSGTNAYRALIPADRLRSRQGNHRALTQQMKVIKRFFLMRWYFLTRVFLLLCSI